MNTLWYGLIRETLAYEEVCVKKKSRATKKYRGGTQWQVTLTSSSSPNLWKTKRAGRGLRETAAGIGDISPSTLSRIEGERLKDITTSTLLQLCDWLEVSPSEVIQMSKDSEPPEVNLPDKIELQLRAAKDLDERTARMIAEMVKVAYKEAQRGE